MPKTLEKIYQTQLKRLPEYGLLFFDHLQAEYISEIEEAKADEKKMSLLTAIEVARKDDCLTWKDIYTFDLTLARMLKGERLRSKILTLRSLYRNVAGQKDFDTYIASNPPDPLAAETTHEAMQQDCQFLLNQFYLQYSMTSAREHMRNNLLKIAFFIAVVIIALGAFVAFVNNKGWWGLGMGVTTLSVVIFAGVVGALVSVQQRIQTSPSEGEPLHNFALLTHGRFGIFLSPISGGISAAVLYLMFTGGLMTGALFPEIGAISHPCAARPKPTPAPASPLPASSSDTQSSTPSTSTPPASSSDTQSTSTQPATPSTPQSTPATTTTTPTPSLIVLLNDFLKETGPCGGNNYAMLVIWAFIAGFAERLVPDALTRLIAKGGS
jgi:hypothetical protein